MPKDASHTNTDALDVLREREALARALLGATGRLAETRDPDAVLRRTCDSLNAASPHIRLSWIALRDVPEERGFPACATGPASDYVGLIASMQMERVEGEPVHDCHCETPMRMRVRPEADRASWKNTANDLGLRQVACFPLFDPSGGSRGALGLYTDRHDYFDRVGLDAFAGFAQLCAVCLEQAELHERLERLAQFDELTELFNRTSMRAVLSREHANAVRKQEPYGLMILDIDRFKVINDNYGHSIGDRVLFEVGRRAQQALRKGDWLARWGGEEFLALLPGADVAQAAALAERVRLHIKEEPISVENRLFHITISAGVAAYPAQGDEVAALLNTADAALFEAKRSGRDRTVGGTSPSGGIYTIAGTIENALASNRLVPAAQPIVDLATNEIVAEQLLARIVTPTGQILTASEFIDAASQLHLAHRIDYRMFETTLQRGLGLSGQDRPPLQFINMSADLLRHPDLIDRLVAMARPTLDTFGPDSRENPLVIEITEREFIDSDEARRILAPLLDLGARIAVDDFGSGYSSFQYLSDLPVSFLKIEGRLVQEAVRDHKVAAILQGVRDIANELGIISLAEWVEDEPTAALVRNLGIHWAQGDYFGEPAIIQSP